MAKEFICGYCGKKYPTISSRTKCEQKCACKRKEASDKEKLARLDKELASVRAKKLELESELKAVKKAEQDILDEMSKLDCVDEAQTKVGTVFVVNGKGEPVEGIPEEIKAIIESILGKLD